VSRGRKLIVAGLVTGSKSIEEVLLAIGLESTLPRGDPENRVGSAMNSCETLTDQAAKEGRCGEHLIAYGAAENRELPSVPGSRAGPILASMRNGSSRKVCEPW